MTTQPHSKIQLTHQLNFILEIDKLKGVIRRNRLVSGEREENSAEHSWHLAIMAMVLAEHANEPVDVSHVIRMVLVHDLVEIDAGDTYAYDAEANSNKEEREQAAAERIFGLLPDDQRRAFRALWDEFEARETTDARFANAIDRVLPLMQNYHSYGKSWRKHHVRADQVRERMAPVRDGSESLWQYTEELIESGIEKGYLTNRDSV